MGGVVKGIVKGIGSLFGGGQKTTINQTTAPPPQTPTVDEAAEAEQESNRFRRRRGRAANVLTSQSGLSSTGKTATKALLGE